MPEEVRSFGRVGLFGLGLGIVYWFVSYEIVGTVMLVSFGAVTLLLAVRLALSVRAAGQTDRQRVSWRWLFMGDAGADRPLQDEEGRIPDTSLAPLLIGLGVAIMSASIAFGPWLIAAGIVPALVGAAGWISAVGREHEATVNEVLAAAKIPRELAAVALIESGFDGAVRSPSGAATGPWQITGKTAQKYGLDVAEGRDERLDVRRSTEAAAALLNDLHGQFGSWDLAVAAYHMGPRAVTQAIAAGGTQDIAELEARGLVPAYRSGVMAGAMVIRDPSLLE